MNTVICETPFTTVNIVNGYATSVQGDLYSTGNGADVSFLSTLRALLYPRIKNPGEELEVVMRFDFIDDLSRLPSPNTSRVLQITSISSVDGMYDKAVENFSGKTYHRIQKITDFYSKQFKVACFVSTEYRSTMVYVEDMSYKKMHRLQCSIPVFLPWFFEGTEITELEMRLLHSLEKKTSNEYISVLNEMYDAYGLRNAKIEKYLSNIETKLDEANLNRLVEQEKSIYQDLNCYYDRINDLLKKKDSLSVKMVGLKTRIENGSENSELMDYFLCNKKLTLISADMYAIKFIVNDVLTYYDSDMLESMINNPRSTVHYTRGNITGEDMVLLLRALFIDERLKVNTVAAYSIGLGGTINPMVSNDFAMCNIVNAMPNIHIDDFGCLGNYVRAISENLVNGDFIGAIEQCIASAKSLNFGDSTVFDVFLNALRGTDPHYSQFNRCIVLPDGSIVKPTEAIEWLKKEDSNE